MANMELYLEADARHTGLAAVRLYNFVFLLSTHISRLICIHAQTYGDVLTSTAVASGLYSSPFPRYRDAFTN